VANSNSNNQSPFTLIKRLELQLNSVLSAIDIYALPAGERKVISALKREIVDARLDVRDYELSETRAEQQQKAADAKKRLEQVRKCILAASEYNVFNAADVAQLTSYVEHIAQLVA
jgi:hypothetical protein